MPPKKRDLLRECNSENVPPAEFMQVFCARCRNSACTNAKWVDSLWTERMSTQVERFLTNPKFADLRIPKYAQIAAIDFPSLLKKAKKRIIADQRGDWVIPEVAITDGRDVVATDATTEAVERAVRNLASPTPEEPQDEPVVAEKPEAPPEPSARRETPVRPPVRPLNTFVPLGGYILGEDPGPAPKAPPKPEHDPWAIPKKEERIAVGATVKMGEVRED